MDRENRSKLKLRRDKMGDIQILYFSGNLDMRDAYNMRNIITELIDQNEKKIILNFRDIGYIDSVGAGILVQCKKKIKKAGGIAVLTECSKWVKKTAHMMNLERVIPIFPSVDQGIDFIQEETKKNEPEENS